MDNENIKEILDKMERLIVYGQYNAYYDLEKQLLDNITNLQEEKDKQLDKYKNVIDKIKEKQLNTRRLYLKDLQNLYDYILELLEEVE